MGSGDQELGEKLMSTFLKELAKSELHVDVVGCVNSGIFLTTEGSEVIDSLKTLQSKGARIATCGTCLDHHKRREKLLIGEVGTMDQTVAIMGTADRIIRP
jgi:hypothetical protein